MTPDKLHELLQTLKSKNSFDVDIAETKKTIRNELVAYRSDQPNPPLHVMVPYPKDRKDIVFYSFLNNPTKPATLETGKVVQVPLFVKVGDKLKINTTDGSYSGRAN